MTTPRPRSNRFSQGVSANLPSSLGTLIAEFSRQLTQAAELAAMERGRHLIDTIFAEVASHGVALIGAAGAKQARRERDRVINDLTKNFLSALRAPVAVRVRARVDRELARASRTTTRDKSGQTQFDFTNPTAATPARRKVRRPRITVRLPPPLDPEQIKRDQEFARLRALLRPVAVETMAPAPAPVVVAPPPVQAQRPSSPGDVLRALEKEIQDAVPTLGTLGPQRCGAQIAAWVGQVRGLRDRLPPDISAAMRPAFRIFLEHLTQLREQMEAHIVDALEPNWKAPDWEAYVEVNRASAEMRAPDVSTDRVHNYHRAMLRALVLPHRRSVPGQAAAIINAAAASLHPEDSLLQSAIRRHRSTLAKPAAETPDESATAESAAPPTGDMPAVVAPAVATELVPSAPSEPVSPENEFDSLWSK